MKTGKKVLSLLLAVCMIFAMVPMMAGAATSDIYKITVPDGITADKTQAKEGETVTLTVVKGYVIGDLPTVTAKNVTTPIIVTPIKNAADPEVVSFAFAMPKGDAEVKAIFDVYGFKLPKGITANIETVEEQVVAQEQPKTKLTPAEGAKKGDTIVLTVNDGYELARSGLKVSYILNSQTTEYKFAPEDKFTFEMPAVGVTVTATFKKVASPKAEITSFTVSDITGEINEAKKTITLSVRSGAVLKDLTPKIKVSEKATVQIYGGIDDATEKEIWNDVDEKTKADFSTAQIFKVIAQDGTEVKYTVTATYKVGPSDTGVDKVLETTTHSKYMSGYEDNTFGANGSITRAEVVAMFYNLLKDKSISVNDKIVEFTDIPAYAWYKTALDKLSSMGVITGYSDGTFGPSTEITRAEFAAIVAKFISKDVSGTVGFPDVPADAWYLNALKSTMGAGWWTGDTAGNFNPTKNITRAEAVTVVNKMLDREPDKEFIDEKTNAKDIASFTDLDNKHWAYYAIIEAATDHKYSPTLGGERWS